MKDYPIYNKFITGFLTGLLLPLAVFMVVFLVSSHGMPFLKYTGRILEVDILTHFISLCVFPNVFAFLLFNRFDKLKSSRGVLGMTIIWALAVFAIKMIG